MAIILRTEDNRSVAGTGLTGSLANVGGVTASPARIVQIFNGCNQPAVVSWDGGTTSGFLLPAFAGSSIDCSINEDAADQRPKLPSGAQFQASHDGTVPTAGTL